MRHFFYLSSCTTCQRIMETLELSDSITKIDIKTTPLDKTALEEMYSLADSYEALFSKRAQLYQQRNLKEKNLTENDFKALLLEHYTFLKRPVLVYDAHIFIGNSKKSVAAAKAFLETLKG